MSKLDPQILLLIGFSLGVGVSLLMTIGVNVWCERRWRHLGLPTPNDCRKCRGLGYCRCEIACND